MTAPTARLGELVIGDRLEAVRAFVHREARLLDERRYEDWLEVWTGGPGDLYWVPAEDDVAGGDEIISYVYDNTTRLRTRVKQLLTGERYSQVPTSSTAKAKATKAKPQADIASLERELAESLNTKVNVMHGRGGKGNHHDENLHIPFGLGGYGERRW